MIGNDHWRIMRTLWVQSNSDSDVVASAGHLCGYRKDNMAMSGKVERSANFGQRL